MDTLFKTFATEVDVPANTRSVNFIISTDSIDRDGDVLDPQGWDLTAYKKNPTVLWSHDYSALPVAKAVSIVQTAHGLAAMAEFPAKGIHPFADTVYELLKGGFLGAASVGFRPITSEKAHDREKGINYSRQELLEWSIVPIPANPEALVQMSLEKPEHKGILKPLVDWSEKFLSEYYGERGVWLTACQVEKTFEAITKSGLLTKASLSDELRKIASKSIAEIDGVVLKPMPMPDGDESESVFMSRCMGDPHMNEQYPDQDQRAAVCHMQAQKMSVTSEQRVEKDQIEFAAPWTIEIEEELVEVDLEQVRAQVRAESERTLRALTDHAAQRAVEYAMGRVS